MQKVFVNDIGTNFRVQFLDKDGVPLDISTSTARVLYFKKPDGTITSRTAAIDAPSGVGWAIYTSSPGDIDQYGMWEIQGKVAIGAGNWHTEPDNFKVGESFG